MNRAPSPRDTWWADHERTCGGKYTKIKEPENYGAKKGSKSKQGKSDAETGAVNGKGQVRGRSDSGTLPRFFKRKIRDSDAGSSNSESDFETGKKKKKASSDDCDGAPLINGEASKRNISKPGSSKRVADVIPFSGPGRTLNSSTGLHNTNNEPLHKEKDLRISSKQKTTGTNKPAIVVKTPSPTKHKTNTSPTLTIVDAFQKARDKLKGCDSKNDCLKSPMLGSQRKPIELLEDSPSSPVQNSSQDSNSTESVQCPVCQTFVLKCKINQHLDSCLEF